jgi:hypothetical protein
MENLDSLLDILYSRNLLLSVQGVQQPCEDPSVGSSSNLQNSKSSLSVLVCTLTQCPPGRVVEKSSELLSPSELTTDLFLCALLHLLDAHLAECLESSVTLTFIELTVEFFFNATFAYAQCPLGRDLQNSSEILYATIFFSTACLLRCSVTSQVFHEWMISVLVPAWHAFV